MITGPRQVGKTYLSKSLFADYDYLDYDAAEHRLILKEKGWDRRKSLIIFDELHKKPKWKQWIKGIYDVEGLRPRLLVTGSAKLNTYRKMGDSLAGRYFQFHLHPIDIKEGLTHFSDAQEVFELLWHCKKTQKMINKSCFFSDRAKNE